MKKNVYFEDLINEFNNSKNSKAFWDACNKLKSKPYIIESNISLFDFANYFKNLYNPVVFSDPFIYAEQYSEDVTVDRRITLGEIQQIILPFKNNKAPGLDRVPYEFFKNAPVSFLEYLVKIFNFIFDNAKVPKSFSEFIIYPLFKKGDRSLVTNYRGICLKNCIAKIFTGILLERIKEWVDRFQILNEYQAGYRKGYSTVDQLFNLINIIQITFAKNKPVFAFFVDMSAALDSIDRRSLFYKLSNLGLSSKMMSVLKALYCGNLASVMIGNNLSQSFNMDMGVSQGCVLSPMLFSLFLNDLHDALQHHVSH